MDGEEDSPTGDKKKASARRSMKWDAVSRKNYFPESSAESALELEIQEEAKGHVSHLQDDVTEAKLRMAWHGLTGFWLVYATMPSLRETPFHVRGFSMLPRSTEHGADLLERHHIAAICSKGKKSPDDATVGQDNFCSCCLPGGFRLHVVADGHGEQGHWVSDRVVRVFPYFMSSLECRQLLREGDVREALASAFDRMQADLVKAARDAGVNLALSGTTAACILRRVNAPDVWVASVGDSRVLLIQRDGQVVFSTRDHKPSRADERKRVQECGCEVTETVADNNEILEKICLAGKRGRVPELGFTRSLGDLMYKKNGVIATPEIFELKKELGDERGHFFIASDGVFEFLQNEDVAKMVSSNLSKGVSRQETLKAILKLSQAQWQEHEGDYCDDITAMLVPVKQVTAKPPKPDDSCLGGIIYASEECWGRVDRLCTVQ